MKLKRTISLAGVALLSAFALARAAATPTGAGAPPLALSAAASGDCPKGTLNASGSTRPGQRHVPVDQGLLGLCSGATVNYNAVGSGQGITDFTNAQTSFAGSDSPLNPDKGEVDAADKRCKTGSAVNLPMVPGPIAVVFNVCRRHGPDRDPVRARPDLRRQDHQVERPGDHGDQQRRHPARRQDH